MKYILIIIALIVIFNILVISQNKNSVLNYSGSEKADISADGGLMPVVGVHNYQVFRANRTHPDLADNFGYTYSHAPMLSYWNGQFYLEYLSGPVKENQAPCHTLLCSSIDGENWSMPQVVFPALTINDSTKTIAHQRMGFYTAPSGKLLMLSYYGINPDPLNGKGIGRAVREIKRDGVLGPVYFLSFNSSAGWNERNLTYPFYIDSDDTGFVTACDSLLNNHLMTQQWWDEENLYNKNFPAAGKAFDFYHLKNGNVVGMWKTGLTSISTDNGKTWQKQQKMKNITWNNAKYFGQQTNDGKYALVYCLNNPWRNPLGIIVSNDGINYNDIAIVHGELPDQRFYGWLTKNMGPQYVRGIIEGNGKPPADFMWVAYSVNKEDIWVSRIPVPVKRDYYKNIDDNFNAAASINDLSTWNIYSPLWAKINLKKISADNNCLELTDSDPYDYARAVRVFPESENVGISFDLMPHQNDHGRLEIEILNDNGKRPVRIWFADDGFMYALDGEMTTRIQKYKPNKWMKFDMQINKRFILSVDSKVIDLGKGKGGNFAVPVKSFSRISFRTGEYRYRGVGGLDLKNADDKVQQAVFDLDNVKVNIFRK
jgi:Sialidase-like, CBM domain